MNEQVKQKFKYEERVEFVVDEVKYTGVVVEWMYDEKSQETKYLVRTSVANKLTYIVVRECDLKRIDKVKS